LVVLGGSEAIGAVLLHALLREIERALRDPSQRIPLAKIDTEIKRFASQYEVTSWSSWSGTSPTATDLEKREADPGD